MKKHHAILRMLCLTLLVASIGSLALPSVAQCQVPARLFTTAGNSIIQTGTGAPPTWCVEVEPIGGDFNVTDIDFSTVLLISPGTGSVSQIPHSGSILVSDMDGNGIQDARVCFSKADLQALFSNFHGNKLRTVTVTLQGNLFTGGSFSGQLTIQVDPH